MKEYENDWKANWTALIELVFLMLLFSAGFLVGHFVANTTGKTILGLVTGFVTCWALAFLYSVTLGQLALKDKAKQAKKNNTEGV